MPEEIEQGVSTTVVHLAGPGFVCNYRGKGEDDKPMSRFIQRCLVCGEKLKDRLIENSGAQEYSKQNSFPAGQVVRFKDGQFLEVVIGPMGSSLPKDFCISLVEEVFKG